MQVVGREEEPVRSRVSGFGPETSVYLHLDLGPKRSLYSKVRVKVVDILPLFLWIDSLKTNSELFYINVTYLVVSTSHVRVETEEGRKTRERFVYR